MEIIVLNSVVIRSQTHYRERTSINIQNEHFDILIFSSVNIWNTNILDSFGTKFRGVDAAECYGGNSATMVIKYNAMKARSLWIHSNRSECRYV